MPYNYDQMDRVCMNCNRRFGQHYGSKETFFCDIETYVVYNVTGKITSNKSFIDSGERCTAFGDYYGFPISKDGVKNPNVLFKRKQINAKNR